MFWNRIYLRSLIRKRHSTNKSRFRLTTDRKSGSGNVNLQRKRKFDSKNTAVRKKRKIRENKEVPEVNIDRISELPDPIIHHIFRFLKCTKDIARTTILCKKWKNVFSSYLTFDFDQRWFRVQTPKGDGRHKWIISRDLQKKKFRAYVDRSLERRLIPVPCIDKFRLYVTNMDARLQDHMHSWVYSAVFKNTKELDVNVNTKGVYRYFIIPREVFQSKSVSSLKLSGYVFYDFGSISMSNLRELSIKDSILITEYGIKEFETGCPLIEDIRLVGCSSILKVVIVSLMKLRRVEVQDCGSVSLIEISASGLECFTYHAQKDQECKINLKGSKNLKSLNLKDYKMTDNAFLDLVSMFPFLEKLVLQKCGNLEMITFVSERVKSLEIIRCMNLKDVIIVAPKLASLNYSGFWMPFFAVNVLGLREAKFSMDPATQTRLCMHDCQRFFRDFDQSKGFKLIVHSKQYMKIYEEPKEAQLVPNLFGHLELTASLGSVAKIVDKWLRESHGKGITLVSPSSQLIKLMEGMIMKREDNPGCCGFYSNKCWRHYIEDVQILTFNGIQEMCYDFKWKPRRNSSRH